jgi:hypothetical protein
LFQLDFDDGTGLWFENENGMSEWINQQFDDIDIQDMLKKFAVFGVSDNMANVPCTATFDSTDPNGNMIKVIDNV